MLRSKIVNAGENSREITFYYITNIIFDDFLKCLYDELVSSIEPDIQNNLKDKDNVVYIEENLLSQGTKVSINDSEFVKITSDNVIECRNKNPKLQITENQIPNNNDVPEWVKSKKPPEAKTKPTAKSKSASPVDVNLLNEQTLEKVGKGKDTQVVQSDSDLESKSSDEEADGKKRTHTNSPRTTGTQQTNNQLEKDRKELRSIKIRLNNAIAEAYRKSNKKDVYDAVIQDYANKIPQDKDFTLSDIETLLRDLLNKFQVSKWESAKALLYTETYNQNAQKEQERENLMTILAPLMLTHPAILDATCTILDKEIYVNRENDVQDLNVKEYLLTKQKISSPQEVSSVGNRPLNSSSISIDNPLKRITTNSLRNSNSLYTSDLTEYSKSSSSKVSERPESQVKSFVSTSRSVPFSQPKSIKKNSDGNKNSGENILQHFGSVDKKDQEIGNYHETTLVTAEEPPEIKKDQDTSALSQPKTELEVLESKIQFSLSKSGHYARRKLQQYYDDALKHFKNNDPSQKNHDEAIENLKNKTTNYVNLLRFISNEDSNEKFWVLITEKNNEQFSDLFLINGKPLLIKSQGKVFLYGLSKKGQEELIDLELTVEEQNSIPFPDSDRSEVTNNDLPETVRDKILLKSVYFNLGDLKYQLQHNLCKDLDGIDLVESMEEKLDKSFSIPTEYTEKITALSTNLDTTKKSFEDAQKKYQELKNKVNEIAKETNKEEKYDADELKIKALAAKEECIRLRKEFLLKTDEKNDFIKKINEEQKTRNLFITSLDVCLLAADTKIKKFPTDLKPLEEWEHSNHIVMESDYEAAKKFKDVSSKLEKISDTSRDLRDLINNNRVQLSKAAVKESSAASANEQNNTAVKENSVSGKNERIISVEERNALFEKSQEAFTAFTGIFNNSFDSLINDFNQEKKEVEKFIALHNEADDYFQSFGHEAPSNNGKEKLKENLENIGDTSNDELLFSMDTNEQKNTIEKNTEDEKVEVEIKKEDKAVDFKKILVELYEKLFMGIHAKAPEYYPDDITSLQTVFDNLKNTLTLVDSDHKELQPEIKKEVVVATADLKSQPNSIEKLSDDDSDKKIQPDPLEKNDDEKLESATVDKPDLKQPKPSEMMGNDDSVKNIKLDPLENNDHEKLEPVTKDNKSIVLQKPNEQITDIELQKFIGSLELDANDDTDKKVPAWAVDTQEKYQRLKSHYSEFKSEEKKVEETKNEIEKLIEAFRKKEREFSDSHSFKKAFDELKVKLDGKKDELTANEKAYQDSKINLKKEICKIRNARGNDDLTLQALIDSEGKRLAELYHRLQSFVEKLRSEKYTSSLELKIIEDSEKRAAALRGLYVSAQANLRKTKYSQYKFNQGSQPRLETMEREERNQYLKALYLNVIIQASDPAGRKEAYAIAHIRPVLQGEGKVNAVLAGQVDDNNDDNQNKYSYSLDHSLILPKENPWYENAWNKFKNSWNEYSDQFKCFWYEYTEDFWYKYGGAISSTFTILGGFALVVIGAAIANPIVMLAGGGVILAGSAETLIASWMTTTDEDENTKKQGQESVKSVEGSTLAMNKVMKVDPNAKRENKETQIHQGKDERKEEKKEERKEERKEEKNSITKPIDVKESTQTEIGQRFSNS